MTTIKLKYGDTLVCDPCYIKSVKGTMTDGPRFDALKCVETLHDGDDGEFTITYKGHEDTLGVDSGRIWAMQAEFGCTVDIDAGFSGYMVIEKEER